MPTAKSDKSYFRKSLIAKIHIAKSQLSLHEDTYRALLLNVTGKESCAAMNFTELERVLERFKSLGFKPKKQPKRAGKRPLANQAHASKIRALWLSLYHLGELSDPSEKALDAYVKRITKVNSLKWLHPGQADQVIRTLYSWMERVGCPKPDADYVKHIGVYRHCSGIERLETISLEGFAYKMRLITTQHKILFDAIGCVSIEGWIGQEGFGTYDHLFAVDFDQADAIIERLGRLVRRLKS